jgi:conjugal transfer/entry exclusion protein
MKKMFLCLTAIALCCTYQARAQWAVIDPSNLAQNILTVSKTATTATTATNVINSFKEMQKIYSQGKEYYDALKSVHNLIKDARKVKETVEMISEISQIYATCYNKMLTDKNFSVAELEAIGQGYAILLKESGNLLSDIKQIVSPSNGLSLSDAERMNVIDQIHAKMTDYRNLTKYYSKKSISISYIRSQEKDDMERVRSLYGDPSERYW